MSEVLAIIPARGGSKGIPRKNIVSLGGKPLIVWTIEAARAARLVSRVVVSTDDPAIAAVSRTHGAEVVMRPPKISGDSASSESALLHVLDSLRQAEEYEPALVVFLQATSPLRNSSDVDSAVTTLREKGADSLFSACAVEGFVWRSSGGEVSPVSYDPAKRPRRQDARDTVVEENGSIYIFKPSVLRECGSRLGGKIAVFLMDRVSSFQVDEPADVALMERLCALREPAGGHAELSATRLLVLDFDGVMTDNRVLVDEQGLEAVWCHRGDGWGIARVRDAGVEVVVLSTETNPVVAARCRKLGIACVQGCGNKLAALQQLVAQRKLKANEVAFVGNDVNDLPCLRWVGEPIAVADAAQEVLLAAKWRTTRRGGRGAVREACDWVLAAKGKAPVTQTKEGRAGGPLRPREQGT